jgi:hypothetical protein
MVLAVGKGSFAKHKPTTSTPNQQPNHHLHSTTSQCKLCAKCSRQTNDSSPQTDTPRIVCAPPLSQSKSLQHNTHLCFTTSYSYSQRCQLFLSVRFPFRLQLSLSNSSQKERWRGLGIAVPAVTRVRAVVVVAVAVAVAAVVVVAEAEATLLQFRCLCAT